MVGMLVKILCMIYQIHTYFGGCFIPFKLGLPVYMVSPTFNNFEEGWTIGILTKDGLLVY
jgi:hypothetical protein